MPHFSPEGHDKYLCQVCGRSFDSVQFPSQWRPDITKRQSAGNVCPSCIEKANNQPVSLYDHCRAESGLTSHRDIMNYMNRHYGHG